MVLDGVGHPEERDHVQTEGAGGPVVDVLVPTRRNDPVWVLTGQETVADQFGNEVGHVTQLVGDW